MNQIYWDSDKICMVTDRLDAASHNHYMIQLFLGLEEKLEIKVAGEKHIGYCIIVNKNVKHSFRTREMLHLTCLFEPTAELSMEINHLLLDQDYYLLEESAACELRKIAYNMVETFNISSYQIFMEKLYECFGTKFAARKYDERITELISMLESCDCEDHMIEKYAKELAISSSRLSHLFREQVGIPIKSYLTMHQVEHAFIDLLEGKKISIAAMDAGFDSPSHFAATVKRLMGLPARNIIKDSRYLKVY